MMRKFLAYSIIAVSTIAVVLVAGLIRRTFELAGINFFILWLPGIAFLAVVFYLATRLTRRSSRQ